MGKGAKFAFQQPEWGKGAVKLPSKLRMYAITHLLTAEAGDISKNYHLYPVAAFIQGIELYALLRTKAGQT